MKKEASVCTDIRKPSFLPFLKEARKKSFTDIPGISPHEFCPFEKQLRNQTRCSWYCRRRNTQGSKIQISATLGDEKPDFCLQAA